MDEVSGAMVEVESHNCVIKINEEAYKEEELFFIESYCLIVAQRCYQISCIARMDLQNREV